MDIPNWLQGVFGAAGLAFLYGAIQLYFMVKKNRLDINSKAGLQTKNDYDYLTSKYRELIHKLEDQMLIVITRLDVAEKTHRDAYDRLDMEHQRCLVESARQDERLKGAEKRLQDLENTKGG